MTPSPRTDSLLVGGLWSLLEGVLFTVAVCLVVAISALLIGATVSLADSYTGSRTVSSLLALLAFVAFVAVPTYLLATRTGAPGATPDAGATGDATDPGDAADPADPGDLDDRDASDVLDDPDRSDGERDERIESN